MRRDDVAGGSTLPSGTVTFLFTDIERSTQSAERLGDARFADQLAVHRALLSDAFATHEGLEMGIEGDALFVAFARAGDAVRAALEGQRALQRHEWPAEGRISVRMGLHTGDAVVRRGEYIGRDVHKAKRVCDAGHGGQTLLSEATAALVAADLDEGVTLADLGHHRLKDLGEPLRIYQLIAPSLPHDFPSLRTLDAFRHNLPLQRSPFVGRDKEITEVRKLLDERRLVTLTGIGGCGKTRLAIQVAAEEMDRFPHGVFLVELAALSDAALINRASADAIGMVIGGSFTGGTSVSIDDLLIEHLGQKTVLLVLDNCEHLLDGCARLADLILSRCPNVTILATTREPLEVEGEQTWPVPSLSVPATHSEAETSEAVALFRTRAQAVQPDFELTPDNIKAVSEICRRLDGLPLAIELAASRVSHLSPRQIGDRLDDMFRLLTGGRRRVPRQQTLAASLDWSYDMLSDPERALLRRLAVFAGTFSLSATEQVCSDGDVTPGSVIDLLRSLVDKSLVVTEQQGSEIGYRLLEPVRLYAAERLRQTDESHTFRERHRDRYLAWVESFPHDEATFGFAAYHAFEKEHDNLRAALEWSEAQGHHDLVARLANGLLTLWWNGGYIDEGQRWLTAAVEKADLSLDELVRAYAGLTACSIMRVDAQVTDFAMKALDAAAGNPHPQLAVALSLGATFSAVLSEVTRDPELAAESRRLTQKAIEVGSSAGPAWKAFALIIAGQIELVLRDIQAADAHLRAALYTWWVPSLNVVACASTLAVTRHILGDAAGALDAARTGADVENEWWRPGLGANSLGLALAGVGNFKDAHRHLAASIRNATEWGVSLWLNEALVFTGVAAFLAGDAARASRLLAAGRHLGGAPQMATPFRTGHSYALYLHYLPLLRAALGPQEGHRTRAEARAMSVEEVTAYALEGLDG